MEPTSQNLERELRLARAAYTPAHDLRQRVLDRVLRGSAAPDTGLSELRGPAALQGSAALRAAGRKALIAVGLISLGFVAGLRVNGVRHEAPPLPPSPPASRAIVEEIRLVPDPLEQAPSAAAVTVTEPSASEGSALPPATDSSRTRSGRAARADRAGPARPASAPATRPPLQHPNNTAREELALLGRAERAVRAGNAALGLALIAELEVGYPRSKLLEERRAVELMAHCAAGGTDARTRAERFLEEQPRSIYAARVEELCGAETAPRR